MACMPDATSTCTELDYGFIQVPNLIFSYIPFI